MWNYSSQFILFEHKQSFFLSRVREKGRDHLLVQGCFLAFGSYGLQNFLFYIILWSIAMSPIVITNETQCKTCSVLLDWLGNEGCQVTNFDMHLSYIRYTCSCRSDWSRFFLSLNSTNKYLRIKSYSGIHRSHSWNYMHF